MAVQFIANVMRLHALRMQLLSLNERIDRFEDKDNFYFDTGPVREYKAFLKEKLETLYDHRSKVLTTIDSLADLSLIHI